MTDPTPAGALARGAKTSEGVTAGVFTLAMTAVSVLAPTLLTLPTVVQVAAVSAGGVVATVYMGLRTWLKVETIRAAAVAPTKP